MDLRRAEEIKKGEPDYEPTSEERSEIRGLIREAIEVNSNYCNGVRIDKHLLAGGWSSDYGELGAMISGGVVRQREDCIEHEWEYRPGANWTL